MGVTEGMSLAVASLLGMGVDLEHVKTSFLSLRWHRNVEPVWATAIRTANRRTASVKGNPNLSLHLHVEDLCISTWLRIVESFEMDILLGMSLKDKCIGCIIPTKREVVPVQFNRITILTSLPIVRGPLETKNVRDNVKYANPNGETMLLSSMKRLKPVPAHTKCLVTVTSPASELSQIKFHSNAVEKH